MKNLGILAALAALSVALRPTLAGEPASAAFLIPNASFEELNPATNLPREWNIAYGRNPICDATVARAGKRSIKFQFQGPSEDLMFSTMMPVKVKKAVTCRVSFYVRALDLDGAAYVFIYRYPTMEQYESRKLTGTSDWQKVEVDVPVVPGNDFLQVRLVANASWGEVWFDNGEAAESGV